MGNFFAPGQDQVSPAGVPTHPGVSRPGILAAHKRSKCTDHYELDTAELGHSSGGLKVVKGVACSKSGRAAASPSLPAGREVGVKIFPKEAPDLSQNGTKKPPAGQWPDHRVLFETERSTLSRLQHPHIVKLFECFEESDTSYLVLELCDAGSVTQWIKRSGRFEDGAARIIFRQMLLAVACLHAKRIVHLDIKPENVLLCNVPSSSKIPAIVHIIKLCDFETAVQLTESKPRSTSKLVTLSYSAPEMHARKGGTTKADTWSLGATLYYILVGKSPFKDGYNEDREVTLKKIKKAEFHEARPVWQASSAAAKDLVSRFLVADEEQRLSCQVALQQPWVACGASLNNQGHHISVVLTLMARFANLGAMERLMLTVMALSMSDMDPCMWQASVPWYDLFIALDADMDGRLSITELIEGLQRLSRGPCGAFSCAPLSPLKLRTLVQGLDVDVSGYIEWTEWSMLSLLDNQSIVTEPEPKSTAFRLLDRPSGDNLLDAADLVKLFNWNAGTNKWISAPSKERVLVMLKQWTAGTSAEPKLLLEDVERILQAAQRAQPISSTSNAWPARCCAASPDTAHAIEDISVWQDT